RLLDGPGAEDVAGDVDVVAAGAGEGLGANAGLVAERARQGDAGSRLAEIGRADAVAAVGVGAAEGDDLGVGGRVGAAGAVAEDGDEPVHAAVARVGARAR